MGWLTIYIIGNKLYFPEQVMLKYAKKVRTIFTNSSDVTNKTPTTHAFLHFTIISVVIKDTAFKH